MISFCPYISNIINLFRILQQTFAVAIFSCSNQKRRKPLSPEAIWYTHSSTIFLLSAATQQRIDVLLTAPMITWRKENTKIGNSSRLLSTFPFFGVKKTSWGAHNTDELNMQLAARPNEQWHNKAKTILKAHFYWCFQRDGTVQLFGT